jgi:maltooligosyltrehalose trehalohydrolase
MVTKELPRQRYSVGAEVLSSEATNFRIWAPNCRQIELVAWQPAGNNDAAAVIPLRPEDESGYYSVSAAGLRAGTCYGYRLDGVKRLLPDPASRFQPQGPDGPSQLVDARSFPWSDAAWPGVAATGQVIYEMHIGTFTEEGTWRAATAELEELARAGMTIIEVMPVAEFAGEFGWGYDGVCLFAPTHLYGEPDDFRRFVDRAHAVGLGVVLDVVYNHFGTVSHSIPHFSKYFRSQKHANEWGDAINFDGACSQPVREFFLDNARYWIDDFHLDGLRFDATQTIHDDSDVNILTELAEAARGAAGKRRLLLVAENEPQNVRLVRPASQGGHGLDALWNDDFHHSVMVRLTGHNEAYYSDYCGTSSELVAAVKRGFLYQGQLSRWQQAPRGTPTTGLPAAAFVTFLQNHDQVANSARGDRIDRLTSPARLRAMTALWLLAPQTPMFFQGQEFAASAPFRYFADNAPEQARRVADGRAEFLRQFPSIAAQEDQNIPLPDPADRDNFTRCKLDMNERQTHKEQYALHIDLLRMRREHPLFRRQAADRLDGAVIGEDGCVLRYFAEDGADLLLVVNFGSDLILAPVPEPLLAPPRNHFWRALWNSNDRKYGGTGVPALEIESGWRIPGEAAVVLEAVAKNEEVATDSPLRSASRL